MRSSDISTVHPGNLKRTGFMEHLGNQYPFQILSQGLKRMTNL